MVLFPSIDLRGGRCVRLVQGDYDRELAYDADPETVARGYADAGATWVHVVDLDGARTGLPGNAALVRRVVQATGLQAQVGGGIRTTESALAWLEAGVGRVVVGTAALADWAWFERMVRMEALAGRVALGLDARDGDVAAHGWTQSAGISASAVAQRVRGWPLAAINYTDISRDGTLAGPNLPAIRAVAESTDVPVVASGGVGDLQDLRQLAQLPIAGVIVGRALYEGRFTTAQALAALRQEAV